MLRRPKLVSGIFDEIITKRVDDQLAVLEADLRAEIEDVGPKQDITGPLNALLREILDASLDRLEGAPDRGIALVQELLAVIHRHTPKLLDSNDAWQLGRRRLRAIVAGSTVGSFDRPRASVHRSGLIVNAAGEQLLDHLRSEFDSADRIDLLCSFVKLSGLEKLRRPIERHCAGRGRPLRVLTTTYMGATDQAAVERLARYPNTEVKVSYDVEVTRLHAKAWLFHRASGVSTAYVGSSNLSHAAQTDGLEWNVRVSMTELPALITQISETFQQYWDDAHQFERFDPSAEVDRERLARALRPTSPSTSDDFLPEIDAKDYQKPILDELARAREAGRHRNLLVAATGTGKTVMAALDYRRLRAAGRVDTLLFVAHRREILEQSRKIFRAALQLRDFGEMLHQYEKPTIGRHVFASIDSIAGSKLDLRSFDMVILDEAHHSGARTWAELLTSVEARELLGMTGTPERADGLDYGKHFPRPWIGNLRVWNAIPHALVPFRYYMLDVDGADLRGVKWVRGRYADAELSTTLIAAADVFVSRAMTAISEHIGRRDDLRAIAFCSDQRHAGCISERFIAQGYRSTVLTAETARDVRRATRTDLDAGRLQIVCVVDLYNEGIDVPNVNTLFFFRPTESATVFLQQLGRGLRRTTTKAELVVFDLTGRQSVEFRFDRRLRALTGHTPRELRDFVEKGTGRLPSGCHFHFDEVAREDVLEQIRRAVPSKIADIRSLLSEGRHAEMSLAEFLTETDVDISDLYGSDRSWVLVRHQLKLDTRSLASGEQATLENLHKLLHVEDEARLSAWAALAELEEPADEAGHRMMAMLFALLYGKKEAATPETWKVWTAQRLVRGEIAELVPVLRARSTIGTVDERLEPTIPLVVHARYLSVELSAAFADRTKEGRYRDYYTGVVRTPDKRYDLLLVTLEKSPAKKEHLKYRDFPLNEHRFHWQSQASTACDSVAGRRHLEPDRQGCTPLLFVRESEDRRPGVTAAFQYLGPTRPDGHEGERPISIEWELAHRMPSELYRRGRIIE